MEWSERAGALSHEDLAYCRFCEPPDKERILFNSPNFYIMLSLGPVVEGYLLLIPQEHTPCSVRIDEDMGREFDFLVDKIGQILKETYGKNVVFYEHGRIGMCCALSEHDFHAHLHCVPADIDLVKLVKEDLPIFHSFKRWSEVRDYYYQNKNEYLLVGDGKEVFLFEVDRPIRNQYLRHTLSKAMNKEQYSDWMNIPNWERIIEGKKKLSGQLEKIGENMDTGSGGVQ